MRTKWCDNILHFYLLTVSGYVRKEVPRSPPDWWGLVIILCLFSSLPETCLAAAAVSAGH